MATLINKETTISNIKGSSIFKFKLEVIENSTNISNNTSNVTINFYGAHNQSSTGGYKQITGPKAIINLDVTEKVSVAVPQIYGTTYAKIATWNGDILHNSDGKKSITVKAAFNPNTTYQYCPKSVLIEQSAALSYIPRTSSFTATNSEIEGNCTINISRAASFTHSLLYSFGSLIGTIATGVATTKTWTIPTSFYAQIPNSKSGTCTITCITYNGNSEIGRTSKNITISCNESKCKPTISGTIKDINQTTINLSGNENKLIKYKSTARITPNASAKNSSSIKSITLDGATISSYKDISEVAKKSFTLSCVDSRGFSNSIQISAEMINYIPLTCNANFRRKTQTSGEIDLNYSGNYFNDSFGTTANSLILNWKYRVKGSTEWIDGGTLTPTFSNGTYSGNIVCGEDFNYQSVYEFIVYFKDKLVDTNTGSIIVTKGNPNFAIFKNYIKINQNKVLDYEVVDEW